MYKFNVRVEYSCGAQAIRLSVSGAHRAAEIAEAVYDGSALPNDSWYWCWDSRPKQGSKLTKITICRGSAQNNPIVERKVA